MSVRTHQKTETGVFELQLPPATYELLGAELLEARKGRALVRFHPGPDTRNPAGLVQGGILAACLDDVVGPAILSTGRAGFFATVSMNVFYLKATRPNIPLVGEARVVQSSSSHMVVEASLTRECDGVEIARATSTNLLKVGAET